jgi:hypothetical protein
VRSSGSTWKTVILTATSIWLTFLDMHLTILYEEFHLLGYNAL